MTKTLRLLSPLALLAAALLLAAPGAQAQSSILSEDFDDGTLDPFVPNSVASSNDWSVSGQAAEANGFGGNEPANDYLISPALNFNNFSSETLVFDNTKRFNDSAMRGLKVLISTDYDGSGNPENFTFTDVSDRVTFSQGNQNTVSSGEVDLSDAAFQADEVYLAFQYQSSGTGAGAAAQWRVDNVEVAGAASVPVVQFGASGATVEEDAGSVSIPVSINNAPSDQQTTVDVAFDGSASNAGTDDFSDASTQTVTFSAGAADGTTQNASFTLVDDSEPEGTETANFVLQNPSGSATVGSPNTYTLTINDNEASPLVINEILADPPSGEDPNNDGNASTTQDEFVEIVNTTGASIDISGYTIEDGNGQRHAFPAGTDVPANTAITVFGGGAPTDIPGLTQTASSGSLGFNNGDDTVTLLDAGGTVVAEYTYDGPSDQSVARDPDFTGAFVPHEDIASNPVAYSPGRDNTDGSPLGQQNPTVQFVAGSSSASEASGSTTFDVSISNPGGAASVDVVFDADGSSATQGEDFTYAPMTVTFPAGASDGDTQTVTVTLLDDEAAEGDETASFDLANAQGAEIGTPSSHDLTISDNDVRPAVTIDGNPGWRMLAPPVTNVTVGELAEQNLIQGVGSSFPGAAPNIYTAYDPGDGCTDGDPDFVCPQSTGEELATGRGFIWYIYDDAPPSESVPLPFTWQPEGEEAVGDQTTSGLANDQDFFLLGNPYNSNYDLTGLNLDTNTDGDGEQDFSNVVEIWDPNAGQYVTVTRNGTTGGGASTEFFSESFETDGSGSRYTVSSTFNDGSGNYFVRTDGSDIGPNYTGIDGTFFFAGEDQDAGGDGEPTKTVAFEGIDISNRSDVTFTGLFGAGSQDAYDSTDEIRLEYSVDGGSFVTFLLFSYQNNGDNFNEPIALDEDQDGDGEGTVLTSELQPFSASIPEGSSLDLRVTTRVNSGDEQVAFDNFALSSSASSQQDLVALGQGFFVERNAANTGPGATSLTFSEDAQTASGAEFYGGPGASLNAAPAATPRVLALRVDGQDAGASNTLYFAEGATRGADAYEAGALVPLSAPYATLAFERADVPGEAGVRLLEQASLPHALAEAATLPVRVQTFGAVGSELTLSWPRIENIPSDWSLTLEDTQANVTIDLRTQEQYTFTRSSGDATSQSTTQAPPALPQALRLRAPSSTAQAGSGADAPRFLLTVAPGDEIPVESDGFIVEADGRAADFAWRTLSETGNDRFVIEQEGEGGTWSEAATVESQAPGGTSTETIRYTARVEGLSYGAHTFRLRQIDRDGTAAPVGEPQRVEIALDEAYALSGAYPNPFRTRATVDVAVQEAGDVTVTLYDATGRLVRTLHDGPLPAGQTQQLSIDAGSLASGVYIVRLVGERGTRTQTLTLVR